MEEYLWSAVIGGILVGLSQLLLLIGCIVVLHKKKSVPGLMMLLGVVLTIVFTVAGFLWPVLAKTDPEGLLRIQGNLSFLNGFAYILFGLGFILFTTMHLSKKVKIEEHHNKS